MKKMCTTIINPDLHDSLASRNGDLVGYVTTLSGQVVKTSIITRNSLSHWFEQQRFAYSPLKYRFVVGTISIVGEVIDYIEDSIAREEKAKGVGN